MAAIDDRENNQHIRDEAISLDLASDARLILTNVVPPLTEIYPEPGYIAPHGYHPTIHGETQLITICAYWKLWNKKVLSCYNPL